MVMVINKKILRSFKENKSRYIGLTLLIIISCMLFTAFQISAPNAINEIENFFTENNVEDAHFTLLSPLLDIGELESAFNVEIEEVKHFDYIYINGATLRVFQAPSRINKYAVIDGRGLENSNEIVMEKKFAIANGINLNSNIEINSKSFKVVGFVTKPNYIYSLKSPTDLMNNPDSFGYGILKTADFNRFDSYTISYSVVFQDNNRSQLREQINRTNTITYWLDRNDNPRISAVLPDLHAKIPLGTIIPVFIFITTCLIISVVLWRLLKTEFTQIGTLYAIGYKKIDILKHYLIYPLILSFTGAIIGTIFGMILSNHIIQATDGVQYSFPKIEMTYDPIVILISFILPFAFLVPTTVIVVLKALKFSPLELMRGAGTKVKIGFLEKRLNLNRFRFNTKFRVRETVRNIPRNLVMVAGIAFASFLLLFGFIMNDSIRSIIEDEFDGLYKYNYQYIMNGLQTVIVDGAERQSAIPAFALDQTGGEVSFRVYGIENDTRLINLVDSRGRRLNTSKVIVNKPLAEKLSISEGDTIKLYNRTNDREVKIRVDYIASNHIGQMLFMPLNQFNEIFGFPAESYTMLLSERELNLGPEVVASIITGDELRNAYENIMFAIRILIGVIAFLASIIGLIVIYILTSLIIEENRFNISLMKVLGYSKNRIFNLVANSNIIFVILGFLLSIPMTGAITEMLFMEIAEDMNMTIPAVIRLNSLIFAFIIMFVTYQLSNIVIRKKVMQIPMAESLKNRE